MYAHSNLYTEIYRVIGIVHFQMLGENGKHIFFKKKIKNHNETGLEEAPQLKLSL